MLKLIVHRVERTRGGYLSRFVFIVMILLISIPTIPLVAPINALFIYITSLPYYIVVLINIPIILMLHGVGEQPTGAPDGHMPSLKQSAPV